MSVIWQGTAQEMEETLRRLREYEGYGLDVHVTEREYTFSHIRGIVWGLVLTAGLWVAALRVMWPTVVVYVLKWYR